MMDEKKLTTQREEFQTGESLIVLYQGKYNGMAGKFVGIRPDPDWADIEVAPGIVRAHPVDWLRKLDGRTNAVSSSDRNSV